MIIMSVGQLAGRPLARMFHESRPGVTATVNIGVLPGVLGPRTLQRTVYVRLGFEFLRLPGGTPNFMVSQQEFMKYPGWRGDRLVRG